MDFDIAKKAIDFFLNHSEESEKIFISFYGGEPLLMFPLIKKCVEYINNKIKNKSIYYSITTNGILLRENVVEFFKQNNFFLTISLDGPKQVNDSYRIYASGKGTFDKITQRLLLLQKKNYPFQLIKFNITIVQDSNLSDQIIYFDKLSKEKGYSLNPFYVNLKESSLKEIIKENPGSLHSPYIKELRNQFKQNLIKNNVNNSPFLKELFLERYRKIYNRGSFKGLEIFYSPNGACIPGWMKLFVDANGDFYICEKMTDFMSIGNVKNGINIARIFEILNTYCEMCNTDCKDCWAIRLCKACYVAAKKNKRLDLEERRKYCKNMKKNLLHDIIFYLELLENNPTAFDFIAKEVRVKYVKDRLDYMRKKLIFDKERICPNS